MLRSASSRVSLLRLTRPGTRRWTVVLSPGRRQQQQQQMSQLLPAACASAAVSHRRIGVVQPSQQLRALSTNAKDPKKAPENAGDNDDDATKEIVLTPGEKVVVASRLGMWAGIAAFAAVCAYYIVKELIPT